MKTSPLRDTYQYVIHLTTWTTIVFDLLLLAGIVIAVLVYRKSQEQRTVRDVWICVARMIVGAMWWQQVIWKTPPTYGGLRFWTGEMVKYASSAIQRSFLTDVVLAHFSVFAPQVFVMEVMISATLLLGLWSRLGSILGLAMAINLWLGLYRSPGEWVWTYVFLIVIMSLFVLSPPGRSLGMDAMLASPGNDRRWRIFG